MGLGTLAHTVGKLPLKELTAKLGEYPIDFVQLALSKAISDIDTGTGRLSPGLANYIAEHFDRQGIRIGVLGCYINPVHPDPDKRRGEIERFKEHLRLARDFGTSIVATETGSFDTFRDQDPERYLEIGWSVLKETVEELAEEAERWGVSIGLEPVCVHTLSTADKLKQLMEEIPSSTIGVVLDPCNLLDQHNFEEREEVVRHSLQTLGDRMVLAHLKDVVYREDGRPDVVKPGDGAFNISGFLDKLNEHKPHIDISIEGLEPHNISESINYLKSLMPKNVIK
ncbi:sugar phosphate isomerase/epimerase [Paenibacillus sp. J2TS4]|uniref:sugar phosphate isomerase/epimerase family protein n=1 Tax=Paenibacillus sp. J2TS4 TaxID=2807194 RepID=UPI001B05D50C|nr:sugar phosphate isomerase/epimerase family protein [Paenibacillus sp. J2TS4]GIP36143.1 endonuclease [Paenibacillus sp. J2TS4]